MSNLSLSRSEVFVELWLSDLNFSDMAQFAQRRVDKKEARLQVELRTGFNKLIESFSTPLLTLSIDTLSKEH
jgi:hypothetical protein